MASKISYWYTQINQAFKIQRLDNDSSGVNRSLFRFLSLSDPLIAFYLALWIRFPEVGHAPQATASIRAFF